MRITTQDAAALRAYFEYRLVILERDGGLSSTEAATEAARLTGCYARQPVLLVGQPARGVSGLP